MRAMHAPLYWFSWWDNLKNEWRVWLTSPDLERELICKDEPDAYRGLCQPSDQRIVINCGYPAEVQEGTVIHEVNHAVLWTNKEWTAVLRRRVRALDVEEHVVTYAEPGLHAFFQQMGLTMPRRPDGYARLSRHARYVMERIRTGKWKN